MIAILLVDSCDYIRSQLHCQLPRDAVSIRQVPTGAEARQALQHTPCDLLIVPLEATLEGLYTNLMLATQVKQQHAATVVVLLASDPRAEDLATMLRPELSDHLISGPHITTQVVALVRRLLRRQVLRHAKIVCTIGPASDSEAVLEQMILAGMNVARLNFSHGDHEWHRAVCARIRRLSEDVAIMADLQGPKLRVGRMQDDQVVLLNQGEQFVLTARPIEGTAESISLDYPTLPQEVAPGDTLYLNDGLIELQVQEIRDHTDILCVIRTGGLLSSRKGIHVPRASLRARVPTAKDHQDIPLAASLGVDFLAVSFVTEADDLHRVRAILHQQGADIPLISKIERARALENFPSILDASDGIMVARGDLAVNIPTEEVPRHQKNMILHCNQQGKPVICATQMLESMGNHPLPTRAEVSDVFNAILDGADAVMLSGESAAGAYPVEAVRMMARIIRSAETALPRVNPKADAPHPDEIIGHGVATMVERFARHSSRIAAIVALTRGGRSARMIAKYRPGVPIIAVTNSRQVARQLILSRGITPIVRRLPSADPATMTRQAITQAVQEHLLSEEDTVLTISGTGWAPGSPTNVIGLFAVKDVLEDGATSST